MNPAPVLIDRRVGCDRKLWPTLKLAFTAWQIFIHDHNQPMGGQVRHPRQGHMPGPTLNDGNHEVHNQDWIAHDMTFFDFALHSAKKFMRNEPVSGNCRLLSKEMKSP